MSTAIQFDDDERSSLYQQESREPRESQESQESQLFDSPTIIAAPVAPAVAAPIMAPPTEPSVLLSGNTFLRAEPSFAVDGSDMAAAIDHQASAGQARMQRRFISGNNGGARNADGRQDANDRQHTGQPEVVTHSRTHRPSLPKPFDVVPADGHALNLPRFRGIPAAGGKSEDATQKQPAAKISSTSLSTIDFGSPAWADVAPVVRDTLLALAEHARSEEARSSRQQTTMMHFDQRLRNMAQRLGALEREEELYPRHDEQVRASRKARTSHDTADLAAYLEHTTTTVDELFNELQRLDQTLADTVRSTEARLAQIEQDRGYEQGGGVGEISLKVRNLIHTELARKVDESVLEELMRHIVTRDELRKTLEKMSTKFMGEAQSGMGEEVLAERMKHWAIETYRDFLVKAPDGQRISAREIVEQARKELVEPLEVKLNKLAKAVAMPQPQVVDVPQVVFKDVPQVVEAPATSITALSHLDDPVAKRLADQLARDFDEKLFLLSSEFDEWRAKHGKHHSPANGALLPAHASRQAQWRWTSGTLKFGANIPWNEQPHNTDPSNFHWSPNTATIKVRDSGIYELAFGIFSRARPTLHLVVNGESVMSAIHSPSYVVRHAGVSGLMAREVSTLGGGGGDKVAGDGDDEDLPIVKQASVTGCTLVDFLLLPPNATISMNFFGNAQAVGFMSLRRL